MYADLTTDSPSSLKRFSHSRRFNMALKLLAVKGDDKVLDYGTGNGFMIMQLLPLNPQLIVGYEPMEKIYQELQDVIRPISAGRVAITNDLSRLQAQKFDKICCLEVLEHLPNDHQCAVLASIRHFLNDQGIAVVSVPIETGWSGLLKNLARLILRQQHVNTTAVNILKSFLGLKIERGSRPFISSHIGFNYRDLEKLFSVAGFNIKTKRFSPLKGLGGFLNSQVIYVLAKNRRDQVSNQ